MNHSRLTLDEARGLVSAAEARAKELGIAVAITVVDSGGQVILFARMDGAQLASTRISEGKAYTSVAWERPSGDLWAISQPGAGGYGINTIDPRFVVAAGGVPLIVGGELVGGIGVSGGTAEQDQECAAATLRRFASL